METENFNNIDSLSNQPFHKKFSLLFFILSVVFFLLSLVLIIFVLTRTTEKTDMSEIDVPSESVLPIAKAVDGKIDAAASYKGAFDVKPSPYYKHLNFYEDASKISKTLVMLPNFKTYQQTNGWGCGASSALMALTYMGYESSEDELAHIVSYQAPGASTADVIKAFDHFNVKYISTLDAQDSSTPLGNYWKDSDQITLIQLIKQNLKNKIPMLVKLGGHWSVIIGYDDMGRESDTQMHVLILADSWDTHDHRQDGYIIYTWDYFWNLWSNSAYHGGSDTGDKTFQQFVFPKK